MAFIYALTVSSYADQLLPQFLMNKSNTLPTYCRHTEHMHEGVGAKSNNLLQNDSNEKLDMFYDVSFDIYSKNVQV